MDELDIFQAEQQIYDEAIARIDESEEYKKLSIAYGRLLKHLRRATRIADRTASNLHEDNLALSTKIHHDLLTEIYNRRFMEEHLLHNIRSLSRSSSTLSVMMIDVDFFKKYNDTYGHSKGDECLKAIALTIKETLQRSDDFVARYGGEEFVVALPNTNAAGAMLIAGRILENIQKKNIPHQKSKVAPYVTVSIGITTAIAECKQVCGDYIKRSDEALYLSKRHGRNQYTFLPFEED